MDRRCWACNAPTIIIRTIETCTKCKKKWYTPDQWHDKLIYDKVKSEQIK